MSYLRLSLLGLLMTVVLAACPSAATSPTEEPTPTPTPTEEPTPTTTPTSASGAGDLAAVLPEQVGGLTLTYESMSGAAVLGSEGVTPEVRAFLEAVGADANDLSMAVGFAFDAQAGTSIVVSAFRVAGADEGRLRDAFRGVIEQQGDTLTETTVAGKSVLAFSSESTVGNAYAYTKGDVFFLVAGEPVSLAEEALSGLP